MPPVVDVPSFGSAVERLTLEVKSVGSNPPCSASLLIFYFVAVAMGVDGLEEE